MTVDERIKPINESRKCDVIELSESEKDLWLGAGRKLARFENGALVELYVPDSMADLTDWLSKAVGETWLVMCSCYELCEPIYIDRRNVLDLAHCARMLAEEMGE
jgi:hypothetical protein